jgi:lipopolysaccharide cholinephosphotransferase
MPAGRAGKALFQWRCLQYQLLTREFVPPKGSRLQKLISRLILSSIPKEKRTERRKHLLALITKDNNPNDPTVGIEMLSTITTPLPATLLERYVRLPFEDGQYMCTALWDEYLRAKFGDYMTLPPEEERTWRHHPILLDFEHDYRELSGRP